MPKYNRTADERERAGALEDLAAMLDLNVSAIEVVAFRERAALEAVDHGRPNHEVRRAHAAVELARADADEAEALLLRAVARWERLRWNARQWSAPEADAPESQTSTKERAAA